jgi:hypothetical protein
VDYCFKRDCISCGIHKRLHRVSFSPVVAKQSITIYQSIAASCLVDRGQLLGRSRPVAWSIAASCLVDRGQLFGRSQPLAWSIVGSCSVDRGRFFQNCLFKA